MKKLFIIALVLFNIHATVGQSDFEQVGQTLKLYINGTANGEPNEVVKAFHQDLNLYSIRKNELHIWYGKEYIKGIKEGEKNSRKGKVISIHIVDKIANAIVEIDVPTIKRKFTDFMLLAKINNQWRIIHKAYTSQKY